LLNPYPFFKFFAFKIDPETVHKQSMFALSRFPKLGPNIFCQGELGEKYQLDFAGMKWPFPVGLAAGLDKNAEAISFFEGLNFGAVEIGTVTPLPQEGNPRPRLFRLKKDLSLLNRMGFNNLGCDEVFNNIERTERGNKLLGVNLGKNKVTPQEKAWEDYQILYRKFAPVADYLVINVSSPNTPGLRDLQNSNEIKIILEGLEEERKEVPRPLFIKVSPDMNVEDLDDLLQVAVDFDLSGLVATNTTIMPDIGKGGVSGHLLRERAYRMRSEILKRLPSSLELIGVGGIESFDDLWQFWKDGGKIAQIYTSFIYQGPGILHHMRSEIDKILNQNNLKNLQELIENISDIERR
jgi:dihydroorotate dehydrogenase